jgi:hypothetical protein
MLMMPSGAKMLPPPDANPTAGADACVAGPVAVLGRGRPDAGDESEVTMNR